MRMCAHTHMTGVMAHGTQADGMAFKSGSDMVAKKVQDFG